MKDGDLLDSSWPAVPVLIVEGATPKELEAGLEKILTTFPATATIKLPGEVDATGESHKVDDYGVAVLNQGTTGNSIEKGGTICMMLAHTCRWYGGTNTFPEGYLVPENKTNVFRYALYPHAGNWRTARTQHAAHEFNHALVARETKPLKKPCLPVEESFVKVSANNVILAAMKPFGNPIAGLEGNAASDADSGIMLRLYDTEGADSEARITFASGIESAWSANLIEERGDAIPVRDKTAWLYVGPFAIETLGFKPGKLGRKVGRKKLGVEAEPVQPVWVRSWEHDAESMPMGYHAMVCSISREVREEEDGRVLRLKVNAVNDYTDTPVAGTAHLVLPEGWAADRASVDFELPPVGPPDSGGTRDAARRVGPRSDQAALRV